MDVKKYSHLMIDLETLGTHCDSVVLSIGAVCFDITNGETGEKIELFPTVDDQFEKRKVQWSSIQWWMKQENVARNSIADAHRSYNLKTCLESLNTFCKINLEDNFKIWGNGFDVSLLNHAYNQICLSTPYSYKKVMDCRTLTWISKISTNKHSDFGDIKHNAISDCLFQIRFIVDAHNVIQSY